MASLASSGRMADDPRWKIIEMVTGIRSGDVLVTGYEVERRGGGVMDVTRVGDRERRFEPISDSIEIRVTMMVSDLTLRKAEHAVAQGISTQQGIEDSLAEALAAERQARILVEHEIKRLTAALTNKALAPWQTDAMKKIADSLNRKGTEPTLVIVDEIQDLPESEASAPKREVRGPMPRG